MDAGSLAAPLPSPSWRLSDPVAAQTQGFVVTGFGALPTGRALFLEFTWPGERGSAGWLDRLMAVAPITSAVPPDKTDPNAQTRAASIAFSSTGLRRMGLPEECLAIDILAARTRFREGMFQEDRLRRLGDRRNGQWLSTVVDGGPVWSGQHPVAPTDVEAVGRVRGDTGPRARTTHRNQHYGTRSTAAVHARRGDGRRLDRPGAVAACCRPVGIGHSRIAAQRGEGRI